MKKLLLEFTWGAAGGRRTARAPAASLQSLAIPRILWESVEAPAIFRSRRPGMGFFIPGLDPVK